ncbi:low specificity L-threonine aldolase [Siculibacillus lacustris]|uniref:L-threonine aldolase n=1 Tax=Siculibacillus lacustris TaxID=1549641 RepID=A0A4Q9VWN3_9HYPH|nr:beta-eliminating lyase-related protein [Siculibacillus lacustris]TBW40745.1 low specificity L-threonine aldolase [Siculibacillus lacustris]
MNFASDNWAGACEPVLEAMIAAARPAAVPAYGQDPLTARVEARLCEIFEREVAVILVTTGTAANALSVAALAPPWGAVVAHEEGHLAIDECGAPEFFAGTRTLRWPGVRGKLAADDVARRLAASPQGTHHGRLSVLSLTQPNEFGLVYTPAETAALAQAARAHGLAVHMDGARFGNALAHLGCTPAEATWRAGVDLLSFGGTKGGCPMAEAIVAFDPARRETLTYLRKRAGQLVSKHRFVAAQFDAWLAGDLWLDLAARANARAARLAAGFAASDRARLAWQPQANEVFAFLPVTTAAALQTAGAHFYDWSTAALAGDDLPRDGEALHRFVTSFATTDADVDALLAALAATPTA